MFKNKKMLLGIFLIFLVFTVYSSEKKARREKNFIIKMYRQGYFQEVLDGMSNYEKLYKKYMDEDLYLAKAESYYNTGDFENALENYEKCVEISEKYGIYSKYSAAYCYMELKNYIKALKYFQEIADSHTPYSIKASLNTARVFSKLMQHRESIRYYDLYMNKSDDLTTDIKLEYSEVLFASDSKEAALNFLEKNIDEDKKEENVKIYDRMADLYKRSGNEEKALEIYEKLFDDTKKTVYAFYSGISFFNSSQYEKAIERFKISSQTDEFRDESVFYIGQSYYLKLDFNNAREFFVKLLDSTNSKIKNKSVYFVAASFYQEKKYKEALEFMENNNNEENELLEMKRDIYIALGDYQKAIEQIRIILTKNINTGYNYYIAGQCYYNLQNLDRALANFELAETKTVSEKIKNSAIFEKAGIYILRNEHDKALIEYSKIPSNSNLFTEAKFKIIDIYRIKKEYNKVLEFLSALETEGTDTGYINHTKAEILFEQKKIDEAINELKKTGKNSTYYEKSILLTANIMYSEEKYDEVKKYIESKMDDITDSNKTEFMYIYGKTLFKSGDYDRTIKIIEDILVRDRNKRSVIRDEMRILLAKSYLKIKNFSQAEANASYVASETDIKEYQIQAQFYLGEAYLLFGNYKQAVLEYLKCALIDAESSYNAKAYFRAGESYQHLERYEDAVSSYTKSRDKGNSIISDMSQKRIDTIETKPVYIEI